MPQQRTEGGEPSAPATPGLILPSYTTPWDAAQPGVTESVDTLVCDGKTLRGSIDQTASGAARFIAQVSLYSNTLGVAIAQNTYATDAGGEIAALRQLLDRVDLNGLLVQADALHANRPFSSTSSNVVPTS